MTKEFEIPVIPLLLNVSPTVQITESPAGPGGPFDPTTTNRVIQEDQSFTAKFKWKTDGALSKLLVGGKWKCDILFERMGGNEEGFNPSATVNDLGVVGQEYNVRVNVPGNTLNAGVYNVVVRIQYIFHDGDFSPFAGFEHIGMINIIKEN